LIKTGAPDKKNGLIVTFSRIYPKKASTRRVNRKIADSTRNQQVFFSRYLAANYSKVGQNRRRRAYALTLGLGLEFGLTINPNPPNAYPHPSP